MEEKRFGVKTSLLNELRLFQLLLMKKRKMNYNVTVEGPLGRRQATIFVQNNEVTIYGHTYIILRNQAIDRGSKISLIIHELFEMDLFFETGALKDDFWDRISAEWTPSPEKEL